MNQPDRILLVDDSAMNIALLEAVLGEEYELASASSGQEALELVHEFKPDLIILDIMMPGLDGFETCRRLRRDAELCHAKIILVSARSETADRLEGYRAGADDYLTKPFDPDELLAKVKVFLRLKFVEELDLLKMDIITLLNHETRTPITGIIGALQVLGMDGDLEDKDRKELIDIAVNNCDRLEGLLHKSLLLSELQSGMRSLTETEVELGALINQVTDKLDSFRQEREVNVVVSGDIRTCIMGDEGFLVFLAESLLHNAIRFSFPGNEVRVNICSQNKKAVLTVTNSGPGIKSAYLPYVFQAFVPQDINHHSTGHGLSLAVCKEIIRAHHGLVEVESTPGKTTCFSVTLPALANTPTDISDQRPAVCQLTG